MWQVSYRTTTFNPRRSLNKLFIAILASLCLLQVGCGHFLESSFELAPESRLPKWFSLPGGLSRVDVTVMLDFYSAPNSVTFTLRDVKKGRILSEVNASWSPLKLEHPRPGFPAGYPEYSLITINGITEIIEHRRMEPIFYITDDPAVWSQLGVGAQ
jgi:hypothetical protein